MAVKEVVVDCFRGLTVIAERRVGSLETGEVCVKANVRRSELDEDAAGGFGELSEEL